MSTGCESCIRAKVNPKTGRFNAGCFECTARSLAGSPIYHAAASADTITPAYRDALQSLFKENWKHGHDRVKYWTGRLTSST